MYVLSNSTILVGDLANTGEGTFSKIWAGLRSKSGSVLELCLDMGSRIKKNRFWLQKCPFKQLKIVSKNPFSPRNSSLVTYKSINYEHLDLVKK